MNDKAIHNEDFLSKEDIGILKKTILKEFPDDQQEAFIRQCERTRLDPFTRQIHATKRMTKNRDGTKTPTLVPVTAITALTAVAVRTGEYDGCEIHWCGPDAKWREEWLEDEPPTAARCKVYHKQRTHPEVAIARWNGFAQQVWDYDSKAWVYSDFWVRMPDFMLAKCAKAAALRGAYPDQLSGTYIPEELQEFQEEEPTHADEQKIAATRAREYELKKQGVKFVPSHGERPSPEKAAEPAFAEDAKKPPAEAPRTKPVFTEKLEQEMKDTGMAEQALRKDTARAVTVEEEPDDIDVTPEQPSAAQVTEPARPEWMDHVIRSITHPRFMGKKIPDLPPGDLAKIETQWIPKIEADLENASEDQKLELKLFHQAIAHRNATSPL